MEPILFFIVMVAGVGFFIAYRDYCEAKRKRHSVDLLEAGIADLVGTKEFNYRRVLPLGDTVVCQVEFLGPAREEITTKVVCDKTTGKADFIYGYGTTGKTG